MACFSNVSGFILILLSFNCEVSSRNNYEIQLSKMEEEMLNMMKSILNLRRDLNKESTERKQNTEVLNRKISQCTCEIQDMNQLQNYIDNVTVRSDVSEGVDTKKIKNLERGLAEEKVLRIMTGEKVGEIQKSCRKLNEQSALKTYTPKIAFHARLSNNLSQFSSGQTIIFDDVYVNLGNGYQRNRGVFRAPIEGIYIVLMTVSSASVSAPDYEVVHNGTPLCRTAVYSETRIFIGSPCNAILSLNVGDEIWARIYHYRSTDIIRGQLFTTFSVGLISMK